MRTTRYPLHPAVRRQRDVLITIGVGVFGVITGALLIVAAAVAS